MEGLIEKKNRVGVRYFVDGEDTIIAKACTKCGEVKKLAEFSVYKKGVGGKQAACKACKSVYCGEQPILWRGLTGKRSKRGTRYFESLGGQILAKECRKCSKVKELAEFTADKSKLAGKRSECKACEAASAAKYYAENTERWAEYYRANREYKAEYNSIYRAANKEKAAAAAIEYRAKNKERVAERAAAYRAENKERIAAKRAKYRRDNPDKHRLSEQRRRARKAALPDTLTAEQYAETLAFFNGACALTGETTDLNMEHAIPLATGHGGTTQANVYPMSASLNFSKGAKNIFEWFSANKDRLNLSQDRFDRLIGWLADMNGMSAEEYRDYVDYCHANINEILAEA